MQDCFGGSVAERKQSWRFFIGGEARINFITASDTGEIERSGKRKGGAYGIAYGMKYRNFNLSRHLTKMGERPCQIQ